VAVAADYAAALSRLLPIGRLWSGLQAGPIWQGVLLAIGDALARVDAWAVQALIIEPDPRSTSQLIGEWESSCGLPDGCLPAGGTLAQRRSALVARLAALGGSSAAYFVSLAAQFGYTVTVSDVADSHWRINSNVPAAEIYTTCNGSCDDPLQTFGNEQLECLIDRIKPAHTQVDFAYAI